MKEGWTYKKLDDICTIVGRIGFRGYTKADLVNSSKDGAITLSPSNIIDGELDFSKCTYINWDKYYESPEIMLENGDIVLVKTASIGKCAVVKNLPHEATLNPQFVVLKQLVGVPDFICYYLKSPIAQNTIKQMAGGVAIPTLSQKKLGMMIVPTPSQNEQQSIVDYLDSAFAKIDAMKANAEKALNEAKALFQASLKEMLEPKEGWEEKFLKDIAEYSIGLTYKPTNVCDDGTIVLRSSNIQEGKLDLNDIVRVNASIKEDLYVRSGDILMCSRNGSARLVGKVCIIPELEERMTYGTFMMVIRSAYNPLLYHYFDTGLFRSQIKHGEANMINQITRYMLDEVKLNLPPISEQESIVTTLNSLKSKVDRLQENFDKISQECDALKQAILRQVFE